MMPDLKHELVVTLKIGPRPTPAALHYNETIHCNGKRTGGSS